MAKVNVAIEIEKNGLYHVTNITTTLPNGELVKTKRRFLTKMGLNAFLNELKACKNCELAN